MYNMVHSALSQTRQNTDQSAYQLDRCDVAKILFALDARDRSQLITGMEPLHPGDDADLLEQSNPFASSRLARLDDRESDGEILIKLREGQREEFIGILKTNDSADAARNLETDEMVDLVEDLDHNQREAMLEVITDAYRGAVESSLNYPEHSDRRLTLRELVNAPEDCQVGDAIDHLRTTDNLPQQFSNLNLLDGKMHSVANVSLGRLMATGRAFAIKDIAEVTLQVIPATQAEADVAYAFNQYHLTST